MSIYHRASFLTGARSAGGFPPDLGAEVAFAGRSNAGKSSALNTLTRQKSLARTSKTPGRTREINFFAVADGLRLVDLPGYGYAKVSNRIQAQWNQTLDRYLRERQSLTGLVMLMDCRHPLTPFDEELVNWCSNAVMPLHILLTKADKLSRNKGMSALHNVQRALQGRQNPVSLQLFSSLKKTGVDELATRLDDWLSQPE